MTIAFSPMIVTDYNNYLNYNYNYNYNEFTHNVPFKGTTT